MTKRDILKASEKNAMNYCMHRGVAKNAFVEGALWAMKECKKMLEGVGQLMVEEDESEL